jgi:hypothetical protein
MDQVVECLPSKCEAPSSNPSTTIKKIIKDYRKIIAKDDSKGNITHV